MQENYFGKANQQIFIRKMRRQLLRQLLVSCGALKRDLIMKGQKLINDEGAITYKLVEDYLNNDEFRKENGLSTILMRFRPECPVQYDPCRGYRGRIDMQVISLDYFHDTGKYGVIECKRLDGSSRLKREYVNEGIDRFIGNAKGSVKYPRHTGIDMMLGYLVADLHANDVAEGINQYLKKKMADRLRKEISLLEEKTGEWFYGDSELLCIDGGERRIDHVMYNIAEVIE